MALWSAQPPGGRAQWHLTISGDPRGLSILQVRDRQVVLQAGKRACRTVRYVAVNLEFDANRGVALAIKPGITQRTQYHCVVIASVPGKLNKMSAEVAYHLHSAHCGVERKALPHAAGTLGEFQLLDLTLQRDGG